MPQLSGIYDSYQFQPIARIRDNLSIWTQGKWQHYLVEFSEPVPPSPATIVDMVAVAGLTTLAANGTILKRVVPILQLSDGELLHLRWEPLDNVEGLLWELGGMGRFSFGQRATQARVDRYTRQWDPTLASTTFWILGLLRDMNLEVRNPMQRAVPTARFLFWGNRMIVKAYDFSALPKDEQEKLAQGDVKTVRKNLDVTTWLVAEGR